MMGRQMSGAVVVFIESLSINLLLSVTMLCVSPGISSIPAISQTIIYIEPVSLFQKPRYMSDILLG